MLLRTDTDLLVGVETLSCPVCGRPNKIAVSLGMPERQWMTCAGCGYRGLLDLGPILAKYGLPAGLSRNEKIDFVRHLKKDVAKI